MRSRRGRLGLLVMALLASVPASACDSHEPEQTPARSDTASAQTPAAPQEGESPAAAQPPDLSPTLPPEPGSTLLRDAGNPVDSVAERLARERYEEMLPVDHLLSRGEVREVTGFTGTLTRTELEGQPIGQNYNAFRLAGDDQYGFGLQVWKFRDGNQATNYFNRLHETYFVTEPAQVGDATGFRAELGGIQQIVFVVPAQSSVVALSCDTQVCPTPEPLQYLAERVLNRL